jgi:signal transduction histidine kinase
LRPVTLMAQQAHAMTADAIDWRLGGASGADELGQLARAFNALLARLAQSAKTQRDFMADASHELRTPVSVIRTAAEVTLDRHRREEEEYRDALTIIEQQSNRLTRLVDDMFVLARADAGGQAMAMALTDFSAIVDDCCRAAGIVAVARGVHLSTEIDPAQTVVGNDSLLRRLVTNLLDNALQYTPGGGSVDVTLARTASTVQLRVADTGPGIPVHERERIFERFVRLDEARSEAGAGLGLPIARWIARGHGATLTVDGRNGGGSVFTFTVAVEPKAPTIRRAETAANARLHHV